MTIDEQQKNDAAVISGLASRMVSMRGTGWTLCSLANAVLFDAADIVRLSGTASKVAAATEKSTR